MQKETNFIAQVIIGICAEVFSQLTQLKWRKKKASGISLEIKYHRKIRFFCFLRKTSKIQLNAELKARHQMVHGYTFTKRTETDSNSSRHFAGFEFEECGAWNIKIVPV